MDDHATISSKTKAILLLFGLILVGALGYLVWQTNHETTDSGSTILIQKKTDSAASHADLIQVDAPKTGQLVSSPINISGRARGKWFFEASFPIKVLDDKGAVIGQGHAQAESDWMTDDFVPFQASITFTKPAGKNGTLLLQKDNPSGLVANDDSISIAITFQ